MRRAGSWIEFWVDRDRGPNQDRSPWPGQGRVEPGTEFQGRGHGAGLVRVRSPSLGSRTWDLAPRLQNHFKKNSSEIQVAPISGPPLPRFLNSPLELGRGPRVLAVVFFSVPLLLDLVLGPRFWNLPQGLTDEQRSRHGSPSQKSPGSRIEFWEPGPGASAGGNRGPGLGADSWKTGPRPGI